MRYERPFGASAALHGPSAGATMINDEGELVDLYLPRKW